MPPSKKITTLARHIRARWVLPRSAAIFALRSASVVGVRLLGRFDVLGLVIFAFGGIGLIDRAARFRAVVSGRAHIGGIRLRSVRILCLVCTHLNFLSRVATRELHRARGGSQGKNPGAAVGAVADRSVDAGIMMRSATAALSERGYIGGGL